MGSLRSIPIPCLAKRAHWARYFTYYYIHAEACKSHVIIMLLSQMDNSCKMKIKLQPEYSYSICRGRGKKSVESDKSTWTPLLINSNDLYWLPLIALLRSEGKLLLLMTKYKVNLWFSFIHPSKTQNFNDQLPLDLIPWLKEHGICIADCMVLVLFKPRFCFVTFLTTAWIVHYKSGDWRLRCACTIMGSVASFGFT